VLINVAMKWIWERKLSDICTYSRKEYNY